MADKDAQDQKDYEDYLEYQKYLQSAQAPTSTTQRPDQSLASRASQMAQSPQGFWGKGLQNIKDMLLAPAPTPEQEAEAGQKALQPGGTVGGAAPVAIPATSLPAGALKLAQFLGRDAGSRIGTAAAFGGAQGALNAAPGERSSGALQGAGTGAAVGAAGEALGTLLGGVGRGLRTLKQAYQTATGSPELASEAQDLVGQAADTLRNGPSKEALAGALKAPAEPISVDPRQLMGHDAEADQVISNAIKAQNPYGGTPRSVELSPEDLNTVRQKIDATVPWKQQAFYQAGNAEAGKAAADARAAANYARGALHESSPELAQAFEQRSGDLKIADQLLGSKDPANFITGQTPGRTALVQEAQARSGVPVADWASTARSARRMVNHPRLLSAVTEPAFQTLKGGVGAISGPSTPATLTDATLLSMLYGGNK